SVAEALLGHEGRAQAAAGIDASRAAWPPTDGNRAKAARQPLTRERREELALAVACDPGESDGLPRPADQPDALPALPMHIRRRHRQALDPQDLFRGTVPSPRTDVPDLIADHQRRDLAGAALARIDGAHDAPAPQDRGPAAEAPHLLELVRDEQDGTAVCG